MSADNWTCCPKCNVKRETAIDDLHKKAADSYGKVSADKYEVLKKEANAALESEAPSSLREDYEIGICEGVFEVSYRASCEKCGFNFVYKHDEVVK